jgi:hypothetical protein
MQVMAWKCGHTGKLFEKKIDFDKHTAKITADMIEAAEKENIRKENIKNWRWALQDLRNNAPDFDYVARWIIDSQVILTDYTLGNRKRRKLTKSEKPFRILTVAFENMRWNKFVSNAHSSPIGAEKNWLRNPDKPLGYPGWTGSIKMTYEGYFEFFISSLFEETGINTETGGGGPTGVSYHVKFFADDWETMKAEKAAELLAI